MDDNNQPVPQQPVTDTPVMPEVPEGTDGADMAPEMPVETTSPEEETPAA